MNFGIPGGMGTAVESYIATPEGQDAIRKFLASPDGIAMLKNFIGTAEGKKVIASLLPQVLGGLSLPPGVADAIRGALGNQ